MKNDMVQLHSQNYNFRANRQGFMTDQQLNFFEIFPWNNNFKTGIPVIDEQHRKLVVLLNQLAAHIANQSDHIEVNDVLFGINVEQKKVKRFRAATITEGMMDYIPILKQKDDNNNIPVVAVRYGKGFLLHIGLYLESSNSTEFKIVCELINKLVERKFNF